MNYRRLGSSGLKVSEVALGGWLTHGMSIADETTKKTVHRAYELGVNLFDTADVYNRGEAEKALAIAIKDLRREDLVVATKCFWPMGDGPNDRGLSRKHIIESVNASLARLGTDYVDLMQFHRYDEETPVEESVRAIDILMRQGKILYWGTSCWSAKQITDANCIAKEINCAPPISNQPPYNMLNREIEPEVIPTSEKFGMGQIVFTPLAQGVLTGKYQPGQPVPQDSRAANEKINRFMGDLMTDEILTKVQKLKSLVEDKGYSLPAFALAWCLRKPGVTSVIVGATKVEQVEANVKASELEISDELWSQAEEILAS